MRPDTLYFLLACASVADTVHAMACMGPKLRDLKVVNADTVEISGLGGTARTRDGGRTWIAVPSAPPLLRAPIERDGEDAFWHRLFRAPDGTEFQNLGMKSDEDVVIMRKPGDYTWSVFAEGLLLDVGDGVAYVFKGRMGRRSAPGTIALDEGMIREVHFGNPALDSTGHAPPFQIEVTSESLCLSYQRQENYHRWDNNSCESASHRVRYPHRALNGFAVAPAEQDAEANDRSRDVYLSGPDYILHWNGATRTWQDINYPAGWFSCNDPMPIRSFTPTR